MVGLIQRLMLDMLSQNYGPEVVARLLSLAGLPENQEFRIDTNYSDSEFQKLLGVILSETQLTQDELEAQYSHYFLQDAIKRWPMFFKMSTSAKHFLERQPRIHNGFASSMKLQADRDRINDKFQLDSTDNTLTVHYKSPHQLCGLYIALTHRVLEYYNEKALIEELLCLKKGDHECRIRLTWEQAVCSHE